MHATGCGERTTKACFLCPETGLTLHSTDTPVHTTVHTSVHNTKHPTVHTSVYITVHTLVHTTLHTTVQALHADADGNILDNPPLAEDIAQDPLLQGLKLIAWVADDTLLPRMGERGFPHWGIWAERNKAFTKDIVSLMVHNQPRLASQVATRYSCNAPKMSSMLSPKD